MTLLQAVGVGKDLAMPGAPPVTLLDDINLNVERGEFVAITGPSGSGKSTLLYLLGGLDTPTRGQILLDGMDLASLSDDALTTLRNRQIGFVYQFHYLLPEFSALENVMMPLLAAERYDRATAVAMATEMLAAVGLSDRLHYRPKQLSGGQQQRVSIARALVNAPALLCGDEPTGNLDSHNSQEVYQLLRRLNRSRQQTILLVTHDPVIAGKADRQIRVVDGRIASDVRSTAAESP